MAGLRETLARWFVRRFDAAAGGRRWQGSQTFGWINAEIAAAAGPIRHRASYFARNNPWIANAVNSIVSGAVGAGILPNSQHPDASVRAEIQRAWTAWTSEADADSVCDFAGLQALAVRAVIEQGECFAHYVQTAAGLRVRLFDGEMVPQSYTFELGEGRRILQGIEFDADGTRVAYWVYRNRPDTPLFIAPLNLVRIPAEEMAHLFEPLAPGQLRGVSRLAPILLRLHELDLYEDAQLVRQKVAALFAGFIVDPTGAGAGFGGDATSTPGVQNVALEPGMLKTLPPGTDVRFSEPAQIGDAVDFLKLQLRSIAAGLGCPEYLLTGDLSQANYSSLRAALVEFRSRLEAFQFGVLVHQLLRPIWRAWVLSEVLAGRLAGTLDDLLDVEWIPPAMPWIDPLKDTEASWAALSAGLTSRRRVVASMGWDVEDVDAEIAEDQARARRLGLNLEPFAKFPTSATSRPPGPTPLGLAPATRTPNAA